jgi:hypothetical protein
LNDQAEETSQSGDTSGIWMRIITDTPSGSTSCSDEFGMLDPNLANKTAKLNLDAP